MLTYDLEVLDLLIKASRNYQQTILMITHNNALAASADRVLHVVDGCLTDLGTASGEGGLYRDEKLS